MNYAYKPTTNGRTALAACLAMEKAPKIVRVAFGSGRAGESVDLADMHELLAYVADGAVSKRRHVGDRFYLTIQYTNEKHRDVKMFLLSEFIVYIEDPETGKETDLLYGTMGDYCIPVPAYNAAFPPSVFNFPLELILSSEIDVHVTVPAGLVTYDELLEAIETHNTAPDAHEALLAAFRANLWHTVNTRTRDSMKPAYGLDGGRVVLLDVGPHTGTAEISAVVSGVEYDAKNMSTDGEKAPDGYIIIKKMEE